MLINHVYQIIERDNLNNYFHAMTGQYFNEWVARKDNEAAGSESVEIEKPVMNADIKPNLKADEYNPTTEETYWKYIKDKIQSELSGK